MNDFARCPACRASWRGVTTCPRCGADLAPLMRLATRAWALRESARTAIVGGDAVAALAHARAAYQLERSPRGRRLLALALMSVGHVAEAREMIGHVERPTE